MSTARPSLVVLSATLVGVVLGALPACRKNAEPAPTPEAAQASATRDGAALIATADKTTLRTVDRLTLNVRATAPEGRVVRSLTIDPEASGWTVVDRGVPDSALDADGRSVRTDTLVLEPFLAGDYTIPPISASFAVPGQPGSIDLATTPIKVTVESVLPEDAKLDELAAPAGAVGPPPLGPSKTGLWVLGPIAAILVACVLGVLHRFRVIARRVPAPDPERELHLLRRHPAENPAENRDRLASILRRARESHPSPSLEQLLTRLDTERYAPPDRRPADPIDKEIDWALEALRTAAPIGATPVGGAA